jgi:putative ABC transport system permease protein
METLFQDLRYGLRMLLKNPGFSAAAVLALGLGIGGNTAIFSVVNAVILRPLPYKDPVRLVELRRSDRHTGLALKWPATQTSYPNFLDWRDQSQSFENLGAYWVPIPFNVAGEARPEMVSGLRVSYGVFAALGVQPILGRIFFSEEDQPGRNDVVLLSHGFWQRRFGSDRSLIGKTITVNYRPHTVVGVMPPGFNFPLVLPNRPSEEMALWVPLGTELRNEPRGWNRYLVVGRLNPGISIEQAQQDLDRVSARLARQYPDTNKFMGAKVVSLQEQGVAGVRPALLIFSSAIGFVLLVACANVANLLLARAAARSREIAIRQALGACRFRLIRQFLTESMLLGLIGGTSGLLLASWGIGILTAMGPKTIPRLAETTIDVRVLGFTLLLSLLVGILFGLVPALQASRSTLKEALKEGGARSVTAFRGRRIGSFLIVSEIALALVLMMGAGLLIKSFMRLLQVDPGFQTEKILTMAIWLPQSKYPHPRQWAAFFQRVLEQVETLPGTEFAGLVNGAPLGLGSSHPGFVIEGRPPSAPGEPGPNADHRVISPHYFSTMGILLLKGRWFTLHDKEGTPDVAIINETAAQSYWPNEDPIGRRLGFGYDRFRWRQIVGVVKNVKQYGLDKPSEAEMYFPQLQEPSPFMVLVVRATSDPNKLIAAVQSQVWAVDKDLPVFDVKTMDERLSNSVSERRFQMLLLGTFAAIALLLAVIGIYGVMSYSVTQRTHEIGIRMALGAQQQNIFKLVAGQGMILTVVGVAIGLAGAFALTRLISGLLFGVVPTDPPTFVAVPLFLAAVALLAAYLPARRAAKVDPLVALRHE